MGLPFFLSKATQTKVCGFPIGRILMYGSFFFFGQALISNAQKTSSTIRIAFGSCGQEWKPQPILDLAASYKPDYFIFLGDNIYGDSRSLDTLRKKYQKLGQKPEFQNLKKTTRLVATWDDHDYGENDAGRHYPLKEASKALFLDFWQEPEDSPRWKHEGIYHSFFIPGEVKIQVILLDTRTFRDNLRLAQKGQRTWNGQSFFYDLDYLPHESGDSTLLGASQWAWLEEELKKPAEVRLICSSTQYGIAYNGYEAWANFPAEQQKMQNLLRKTRAEGVLFLSGDVHYGEISRIEVPDLYPIYDFTSSGITSTWHFATPNAHRVEGPVMENHFGWIEIKKEKEIQIDMKLVDVKNNVRFEDQVKQAELRFGR
jgi:alkaline phosphatase D